MTVQDDLTIAAAHLARSAPQEWRTFLAALEGYYNTQKENLVTTPLTELPRLQGGAATSQALLKIFGKSLENSVATNQRPKGPKL